MHIESHVPRLAYLELASEEIRYDFAHAQLKEGRIAAAQARTLQVLYNAEHVFTTGRPPNSFYKFLQETFSLFRVESLFS